MLVLRQGGFPCNTINLWMAKAGNREGLFRLLICVYSNDLHAIPSPIFLFFLCWRICNTLELLISDAFQSFRIPIYTWHLTPVDENLAFGCGQKSQVHHSASLLEACPTIWEPTAAAGAQCAPSGISVFWQYVPIDECQPAFFPGQTQP